MGGGGPGATSERTYWAALTAVGLAALVAMVRYGQGARLEYDGWWHVFIARSAPWASFWREVYFNAHPPLYYLLLRSVAQFGHTRLAYRSISFLAALASIALVAAILRRSGCSRSSAVLGAATFGLATSTVVIAGEVRSYMVGTSFMLAAHFFFLDLVGPDSPAPARARVGFAVAMSLAILTHYVNGIVLLASLCTWLGLVGLERLRPREATPFLPGLVAPLLQAFGLPMGVALAAHAFHVQNWTAPMWHLAKFYRALGEDPVAFVVRTLRLELELFSPVRIGPPGSGWLTLAVGAGGLGLLWLGYRLREDRDRDRAAAPPALFVLLTAGLLAAGLAGRYPFGGELRHQFVLFPFGVMTALILWDRAVRQLSRGARRAAVVLLAGPVAASLALHVRDLRGPGQELFTESFAAFSPRLAATTAVYLDQFSLIAFFTHTQDCEWRLVRPLGNGRQQLLRVTGPGRSFLVLRDLGRWSVFGDLAGFHRSLGEAMRETGLGEVALFHVDHMESLDPATAARNEASTRTLGSNARQEGLRADNVEIRPGALFVTYVRAQASPSGAADLAP